MYQNARLAWSVAGVLALLLLLALFLNFRQTGPNDLRALRAQIQQDCTSADTDRKARCADTLTELSTTLQQFSKDLSSLGTTTPR